MYFGKRKIVLLVGWLAAALISLAVAGCSVPVEQGQAPADLRIAVTGGVETIPLIAAGELGLFPAEGITVELIKTAGWRETDLYLQSGAVHGALTGLSSLFRLQEQGFLVMAASESGAAYSLLAAPEQGDSLNALPNMKVALSDNPEELFFLEELLLEYDLALTDLQLEIAADSTLALGAFLGNAAAAVLLPRHLEPEALAEGAVVISGSRATDLCGGVITFSGEALQQKEEQVASFYRAYSEAIRLLNQGSVDLGDLALTDWGYPEAFIFGGWPAMEEPRAVSREKFHIALRWYRKQGQPESSSPVYEGVIWRGLSRSD
ncbi:MAG: ABC transporter substrate-binding protein [Bacillota bacterium]